MGLDIPPYLQRLEQEGVVLPNLSGFGKKKSIYGHTACCELARFWPCDIKGKTRLKKITVNLRGFRTTCDAWNVSDV